MISIFEFGSKLKDLLCWLPADIITCLASLIVIFLVILVLRIVLGG